MIAILGIQSAQKSDSRSVEIPHGSKTSVHFYPSMGTDPKNYIPESMNVKNENSRRTNSHHT